MIPQINKFLKQLGVDCKESDLYNFALHLQLESGPFFLYKKDTVIINWIKQLGAYETVEKKVSLPQFKDRQSIAAIAFTSLHSEYVIFFLRYSGFNRAEDNGWEAYIGTEKSIEFCLTSDDLKQSFNTALYSLGRQSKVIDDLMNLRDIHLN